MDSITRRRFFAGVGAVASSAALPAAADAVGVRASGGPPAEVQSSAFRLSLAPDLKSTRLLHRPSGLILADADYSYSFERPAFQQTPLNTIEGDVLSLHFQGSARGGSLEIMQRISLPLHHPWLEEEITLTNRSSVPLDLSGVRCGFVLPTETPVSGSWKDFKFIAVPYRREPQGGKLQYFDFALDQILHEEFRSELITYDTKATPVYASEGWAWTNGKLGFLVTKYSQDGMEWSILDRVPLSKDRAGFRWGGIGTYLGKPEHGAWLHPGQSHTFGATRITAYDGGMLEGYYTFRREMAERGHGCPPGFNPPVHWNELYDNKLWWLPDDQQGLPEMRKKYYQLSDMREAAAKAQAIGCQALYLDPGWDTLFASKIWDESRLGPCKDFVEMLRRDYGLKLSLHTPLSGWCDAPAYPVEMYRVDRFGQRLTWKIGQSFGNSPLCGASRQYVDETARRLKVLARDGATFFMFDGDQYEGECWDPNHGHSVPARREEHVQGNCALARLVHEDYPHVLIEMHGPTPSYYGHGRAATGPQAAGALGYDSVWAFELMWRPMDDLLSGRSITLYYYALAYGLPLYIHIDLRTDNANALVFWWNASTCRHLGIGGTHEDVNAQKAHREAMATYLRFQAFFKAGAFYGVDEMVHVHVHSTEPAAVVNCFNLEDHAAGRTIEFEPAKFGLPAAAKYDIKGGVARREADRYVVEVEIPAQGHVLLEVQKAT